MSTCNGLADLDRRHSRHTGALKVRLLLLVCILLAAFPLTSCSEEQSRSIRFPAQKPSQGDSEAGVGDLYALVVGVSHYRHPGIAKLSLADKDARDFAAFLGTQKELFRNIHLTLLVDEKATQQEVNRRLLHELRLAGKNDTVILFFAGHGTDDPNRPGDFFFLTYDSDPQMPEATAINMSGSGFMERMDSKRVLMIADACHAGGFTPYKTRSAEPSFQRFMRQMNDTEGRMVFSASRPDEVSLEKAELKNGVFTHYLLQGLKGAADTNRDSVVTLQEIYGYVYEKTKDNTRGVQHPQLAGRVAGRFPLALARLHDSPASEVASEKLQSAKRPQEDDWSPYVKRAEQLYRFSIFGNGRLDKDLRAMFRDAEAVEAFRAAAGKGVAFAQYLMGRMSDYGGIRLDDVEAVKWYRLSAEQGCAAAQARLGDMYERGRGVAEDLDEAGKWFRLAAEQGNAEGEEGLAKYNFGRKRVAEGLKWLKIAAAKGYVEAQAYLGFSYMQGCYVVENYGEALKWMKLAAEQGDEITLLRFACLCAYEDQRREGCDWLSQSAEQGDPMAQWVLGSCYSNGCGGHFSEDTGQAVKWYRLAAEQGEELAQRDLGEMYYRGKGVSKDYGQAAKWFRLAADQGCGWAQRDLGEIYYRGKGIPKDYREALKWFQLAAQSNIHPKDEGAFRNALYLLGLMYKNGEGVPKDLSVGKEWFRKAADEGHDEAKKELSALR